MVSSNYPKRHAHSAIGQVDARCFPLARKKIASTLDKVAGNLAKRPKPKA